MPFEEFTSRVVVSLGDASVQLRARRMEGKPSLIIGLLKSFTTAHKIPFKAADTVDVLVGTGDDKGKLRLRKSKGSGCGSIRVLRLGGLAVDCGHIVALGIDGRAKLKTSARVTPDGMIEIDLPSDDAWKAATEAAEDEALEDEEEDAPAAPSKANGGGETKVSAQGITVDLTPEEESISFGMKKQEVTTRQAAFLAALLRGMPGIIDRDFLRRKMFANTSATAGDVQLDMVARDLIKTLPTIELKLNVVKGIGYSLMKI